jgi:predicted transcriptional regulator of viral defense system
MGYNMNTKKTILSERELILIEDMIAKYGLIVNFDQIYSLFQEKKDRQSVRKLVNKFTKNGWLVRIKKGIYSISNIESRGFLGIPSFKIAQVLVDDSYISFESALGHYGMFDQMLIDIVSVSLKQHKTKTIQGINYRYVKVKECLFSGWEEANIDGYVVKIATKEKAILDLLAFKRNLYTIDLVLEKMKEYQSNFNFQPLQEMSLQYSKTIQKMIGFLLDLLFLDSTFLYIRVQKDRGLAYMTKDSNRLSNKWHLYYDKHFEKAI